MKYLLSSILLLILSPIFAQKALSADDIINKYLLLSGNIKNVSTLSYYLSNGGQIRNAIKYKSPSKLYISYFSGDVENQKMCFDGKKCEDFQLITKIARTLSNESFLREMLSNTIFPELLIHSLGIKVSYLGEENINKQKAHKIKFEGALGAPWFEFFDVSSGLKIRTSYEIKADNGELIPTIIEFQNYQDSDAFHVPKLITISFGAVSMPFFIRNLKANESLEDSIFEGK